jgi:hypothetical protein
MHHQFSAQKYMRQTVVTWQKTPQTFELEFHLTIGTYIINFHKFVQLRLISKSSTAKNRD